MEGVHVSVVVSSDPVSHFSFQPLPDLDPNHLNMNCPPYIATFLSGQIFCIYFMERAHNSSPPRVQWDTLDNVIGSRMAKATASRRIVLAVHTILRDMRHGHQIRSLHYPLLLSTTSFCAVTNYVAHSTGAYTLGIIHDNSFSRLYSICKQSF